MRLGLLVLYRSYIAHNINFQVIFLLLKLSATLQNYWATSGFQSEVQSFIPDSGCQAVVASVSLENIISLFEKATLIKNT